MAKDLIREDTVLGKKQVITGSSDKDLVLQTKGKVKIQQGSKFIDLIDNGKVKMPSVIYVVDKISDIGNKTGFYFVKENSTLYALVENNLVIINGSGNNNNNENNTTGVNKLSELSDVLLIDLRDGDLLVYQNGFWVNSLYNIEDLGDIQSDIGELKQAIKAHSLYTQRTFQDVMETFEMMFDPEGSYFTEKIKPLAVHTAQLIVGTNSQQFNLENIRFEPNYKGECNDFGARVIDAKPGLLVHNTIGLENESNVVGRTWEVLQPNGKVTELDYFYRMKDNLPYYLYAKCDKNSNSGEFIISNKAILLEEVEGYYYFWVGVLNTPRASLVEGGTTGFPGETIPSKTVKASLVRSFQCMFGFTEIAGNQITTGVIKDNTGTCYWDMINGAFRIGNENSYIYYDAETKQLYLKGNLVQVDPNAGITPNWRGEFIPESVQQILYKKGDLVSYNGSIYICTKDTYNNILPTNKEFWDSYVMTTFTKFIYANFKEGEVVIPDNVVNPTNNGWSTEPKTPDYANGEYTWMSQSNISNDTLSKPWSEPIRITGANGEAGVDGGGVEFIYRRSQYNNVTEAPTSRHYVDGYVPSYEDTGLEKDRDWTDHPSGISDTYKYEFICIRSKAKGSDYWSNFSSPVIWSKWGEKGMDGDGYEYIFKRVEKESDKPIEPQESPQIDDWFPEAEGWSDDPLGVSEKYKFEYVTKRKKEKGIWGAWSPTALWSKWSKDGHDGEGTIMIYRLFPFKPETPKSEMGKRVTDIDANKNPSPNYWSVKFPELINNTVYISPKDQEPSKDSKLHLNIKTSDYSSPEEKVAKIVYSCSTEPNYDKLTVKYDDSSYNLLEKSGEIYDEELKLTRSEDRNLTCTYRTDSSQFGKYNRCWIYFKNTEVTVLDDIDTDWTLGNYYVWMSLATIKNGIIASDWSEPIQWGSNGTDLKLIYKNNAGKPPVPSKTEYKNEGWSNVIKPITDLSVWYSNPKDVSYARLRIQFYKSKRIKLISSYKVSGNNEVALYNTNTSSYIKRWGGSGNNEVYEFNAYENETYILECDINSNYKEDFFSISLDVQELGVFYVEPNDWTKLYKNTWMSSGYFKDGVLIGDWSVPVQITAYGKSNPGAFKSTVFRRYKTGDPTKIPSYDKIPTPTGGNYNKPIPDGGLWSDGVPEIIPNTDNVILWSSTRTFTVDGEPPQDPEWSRPIPMTDTSNFDVEYSSKEHPNSPTGHPNTNRNDWSNTADSTTIWMATSTCRNGEWTEWQVSKIKGEKGLDAKGEPGDIGPSVVFRGTYERRSTIYFGTSTRTDVVYENGNYWIANYLKTKDVSLEGGKLGQFKGDTTYSNYDSSSSHLDNTNYWLPFGASFSSVATDFLFAKTAALGGWNFNNQIMWSNDKACYLNGKVNNTINNNEYPIIAASNQGVITEPTDVNSTGRLKTTTELKNDQNSFFVDSNGRMFANSGEIGGWNIDESKIYTTEDSSKAGVILNSNDGTINIEKNNSKVVLDVFNTTPLEGWNNNPNISGTFKSATQSSKANIGIYSEATKGDINIAMLAKGNMMLEGQMGNINRAIVLDNDINLPEWKTWWHWNYFNESVGDIGSTNIYPIQIADTFIIRTVFYNNPNFKGTWIKLPSIHDIPILGGSNFPRRSYKLTIVNDGKSLDSLTIVVMEAWMEIKNKGGATVFERDRNTEYVDSLGVKRKADSSVVLKPCECITFLYYENIFYILNRN